MNNLTPYLVISSALFVVGIVTVLSRKNIIAMLLGVELILNSAALNFVAYTRFGALNLDGHIMALFIIVVAAAEAALGLAIVIGLFQIKESIHIDDATELQH